MLEKGINMISELQLLAFIEKRFGGISTNIKDKIMEYVGPLSSPAMSLKNYHMTMQTVIIELKGIHMLEQYFSHDYL